VAYIGLAGVTFVFTGFCINRTSIIAVFYRSKDLEIVFAMSFDEVNLP